MSQETHKMRWSDRDIQFLVANYATLSNKQLGEMLNRSTVAVVAKGRALHLAKSSSHLGDVGRSNSKAKP